MQDQPPAVELLSWKMKSFNPTNVNPIFNPQKNLFFSSSFYDGNFAVDCEKLMTPGSKKKEISSGDTRGD